MSLTLPTHPTKRHPLTGKPIRAIALHPRTGLPVWQIMGGDDTVPPAGDQQQSGQQAPPSGPQRPEGVSEQEWEALGDPGKSALVRERGRAEAAERALAAARARPVPPGQRGNTSGQGTGGQGNQQQAGSGQQAGSQAGIGGQQRTGGELDVAAIVQQAVDAAVKPFLEAEEQRQTQAAAEKIQTAVIEAAKARLHDATDALAGIDLTTVVNERGEADPDKIKTALDDLVTRKPHLAKSGQRQAPPGIGGGSPAAATEAEKVKAALAEMQRATGIRPAATTTTI